LELVPVRDVCNVLELRIKAAREVRPQQGLRRTGSSVVEIGKPPRRLRWDSTVAKSPPTRPRVTRRIYAPHRILSSFLGSIHPTLILGCCTTYVSNELDSGAASRDAGVARIRNLTRGALVGAALLSGVFAGLAAASTHVRKATHVATHSARRAVTSVPAAVPAPAPRSAQVPVPVAPSQVPSQSTAPPVASSGGS
jgi:hypothetical protein